MKFTTVFTTLVFSVSAVLGAALPAANEGTDVQLLSDVAVALLGDVPVSIEEPGINGNSTDLGSFGEGVSESGLEARNDGAAGAAIGNMINSIIAQAERDKLVRLFSLSSILDMISRLIHELYGVEASSRRRLWLKAEGATLTSTGSPVTHKLFPNGVRGKHWGHYHREYDIKIGGTIGYEIYWFYSDRFERHGDGGFLNVRELYMTFCP